jgi:RND family efflux transporter MFP subunit
MPGVAFAVAQDRAWRVLLAFLLPAILAVAVGCRGGAEGRGGADAGGSDAGAAPPTVPVEVAPVEIRTMDRTVGGTTWLRASAEVSVVAEIAGRITRLEVEVGDRVEGGALLARIENPDVDLTIREARRNVAFQQRERDALQPLFDQGYLSRQAFEQAEFQLRSAEAELARVQRQAGTQVVRAPSAGVVTTRAVQRGDVVVPNQAIVTLSTVDALEAWVAVPERELIRLRVDQAAGLQVDALAGDTVPARVHRIDPVVDPVTGTVQVRLAVEGPLDTPSGVRLRPGMLAQARITVETREGIVAVPRRAVVYEGDIPWVFVLDAQADQDTPAPTPPAGEGSGAPSATAAGEGEGSASPPSARDSALSTGPAWRIRRVRLEPGLEDATHIEVRGGIEAGRQVIVSGQNGLDPAALVVVATPPETP